MMKGLPQQQILALVQRVLARQIRRRERRRRLHMVQTPQLPRGHEERLARHLSLSPVRLRLRAHDPMKFRVRPHLRFYSLIVKAELLQ